MEVQQISRDATTDHLLQRPHSNSSLVYLNTSWTLSSLVHHSHTLPLMNGVSHFYAMTTTTMIAKPTSFTNVSVRIETDVDSAEVPLKIAMGLGLYSLALLTFIGNAMVLHAIRTEKRLQTVSNLFIMSLAVADLIVGLFVMPISAAYTLTGQWTFGVVICEAWLSIDYTASTASIYNLFILSLDRYWSITSPLRYIRRRTRKRARLMIAAAWILSFMWVIPVTSWHWLFRKGTRLQPTYVCETEFASVALFKVTTAVANFYIPTILMVYIYGKIFYEIRQRSVSGLAHQSRSNSSHQQQHSCPSAASTTTPATRPHLQGNWGRRSRSSNCQLARRTSLHRCFHIQQQLTPSLLVNNGNPANVLVTHNSVLNSTSSLEDLTQLRLAPDCEELQGSFFKHPQHRRCHRSHKYTAAAEVSLSLPFASSAASKSTSHYQSLTLLALPLSPPSTPTADDCLKKSESITKPVKLPAPSSSSSASATAANFSYFHGIQVQVEYVPDDLSNFAVAINGYAVKESQSRVSCRSRVDRRTSRPTSCPTVAPEESQGDKRTSTLACSAAIRGRKRCQPGNLQHTKSKVSLFVLQKEKKAARQLGVIVAAFLLCWLPYFVLFAVVAQCEGCVDKRLYTWTVWLGYINSTLNPFLYPLCNTNFKRAFKRMLRLTGKVRPSYSYPQQQQPYLMQMNSALSMRETPERLRY